MPLVEQKLHTLPEHLSSPPVFSGDRVTRFLFLYVCFVDRCGIVLSSIYGFWLPLWYLQTFVCFTPQSFNCGVLCRVNTLKPFVDRQSILKTVLGSCIYDKFFFLDLPDVWKKLFSTDMKKGGGVHGLFSQRFTKTYVMRRQ